MPRYQLVLIKLFIQLLVAGTATKMNGKESTKTGEATMTILMSRMRDKLPTLVTSILSQSLMVEASVLKIQVDSTLLKKKFATLVVISGILVLHLMQAWVGAMIQVKARAEVTNNLKVVLDGETMLLQTTGVALVMLWVPMMIVQETDLATQLTNVTSAIKLVTLLENVLQLLKEVVMPVTSVIKKVTLLRTVQMLM